jgi:hypothetical protein
LLEQEFKLLKPIFELKLGFVEDSSHDQGHKLLIMGSKILCCSSNFLDNDQGIVEHHFYIGNVLTEVKQYKPVDEVDPANDLLLVEEHLHRKLS